MKLVFWLVVFADTAVLLILFVLGLAAAPSSRTSAGAVAAFMLVIPGLFLGASVLLFTRTTSPGWRAVALLMAGAPMILVVGMRGIAAARIRSSTDAQGNLTFFPAGPMREMAGAISRNDTAAIATLAPKASVNGRGLSGMTLLVYALRQMRNAPTHGEAVRALLHAGANPNLGTDELPLEVAIQISPANGIEPVRMLLAAGADPNARNHFGMPIWFTAAGGPMDPALLTAVLEHGADLKARDAQGGNAVLYAANGANWQAVLLLLRRGADWKEIRTVNGLTFKDKVESDRRVYGEKAGLAEVMEFLNTH